jgi:hypothetical protein
MDGQDWERSEVLPFDIEYPEPNIAVIVLPRHFIILNVVEREAIVIQRVGNPPE